MRDERRASGPEREPDREADGRSDLESAAAVVRAAGLRYSTPRRLVLEALYAADEPLTAAKIEQQAQTLKGKWRERKRRGAGPRTVDAGARVPEPATNNRRVIRATRYAVKPMSVEDAALRVSEGSETFVVFRNADTDAVSIIYRRNDGHYGLIEPD